MTDEKDDIGGNFDGLTDEQIEMLSWVYSDKRYTGTMPQKEIDDYMSLPSIKGSYQKTMYVTDKVLRGWHDPEGIQYSSIQDLRDAAIALFEVERPDQLYSMNKAFENFERLCTDSEQAETIKWSLTTILTAAVADVFRRATRNALKEEKSLQGITARNQAIAAAADRARSIAVSFWAQDREEQIRIGEMAQRVWGAMIDEGLSDHMPEQADRLKVWIKPVAPEYATKGGRSKKPPRT